MALGNRIGVEFDNLTKKNYLDLNYGTIILEVKNGINIEEELKDCRL